MEALRRRPLTRTWKGTTWDVPECPRTSSGVNASLPSCRTTTDTHLEGPRGSRPKPLTRMRRITEEICNQGRVELVEELISDYFVDHLHVLGLEVSKSCRDNPGDVLGPPQRARCGCRRGRRRRLLSTHRWDERRRDDWHAGKRVECETIGSLRFTGRKIVRGGESPTTRK